MTLTFDSFRLAASTADLSEESAAREHADCVEFRMDLADDPLDALAEYDGELPLLVTNRADWEGGEADDGGRIDALKRAIEHEAVEAVDIELAALEDGEGLDLVEAAEERDVSVVVSTHDFEGTPSKGELQSLLTRASTYGDVAKLAVTAESRADALALLGATHEMTGRGERVATMAMGEAGSHTRAVAPVYGSKIGYAPVDPEKATAPGQYDLETLRELVDRLT
ncbi:type I 3-dehydroquinate dehydratase [Natronomonas halophila]|uniref:type I 3-dehydroquinate dehydratase n=1 Tax=Natronomonas halophila TaxID=2747817 RepID=UPI0015B4DCD3|nr:type I 3-dehydroquinate dehydratase [Natronomonas halophila]QLD86358.1 type I 3-dehydroquinate dehydratase [Natronomonas halophila]